MRDYPNAHDADPKPSRWTTPADTIISNRQRGKHLPDSLHWVWREPAIRKAISAFVVVPNFQGSCANSGTTCGSETRLSN